MLLVFHSPRSPILRLSHQFPYKKSPLVSGKGFGSTGSSSPRSAGDGLCTSHTLMPENPQQLGRNAQEDFIIHILNNIKDVECD